MQRYFIQDKPIDGIFEISGDDYHHITRVMRMDPGDEITVVFPDGRAALSEIVSMEHGIVKGNILYFLEEDRELPVRVTIASSILKGDKFDFIIQKGTELGADAFVPFISSRSVVKLDAKKAAKRLERWKKIAKEASEQSERNKIPVIHPLASLDELPQLSSGYTIKVVAYEEKGRNNQNDTLPKILNQLENDDTLFFVFGPEGGFSEQEIDFLEQHDFRVCGLGPRILRAETAPLYALASISFYFECLR